MFGGDSVTKRLPSKVFNGFMFSLSKNIPCSTGLQIFCVMIVHKNRIS